MSAAIAAEHLPQELGFRAQPAAIIEQTHTKRDEASQGKLPYLGDIEQREDDQNRRGYSPAADRDGASVGFVRVIGRIEQTQARGHELAERSEDNAAEQPYEKFSHHGGIIASWLGGARSIAEVSLRVIY